MECVLLSSIINILVLFKAKIIKYACISVGTKVSLMRDHGGNSPGRMISLSLVEAQDACSTLSLSKAGQLFQQCNLKWLNLMQLMQQWDYLQVLINSVQIELRYFFLTRLSSCKKNPGLV